MGNTDLALVLTAGIKMPTVRKFRGVDVNRITNGTTALIVAVKRGKHVRLLLDRGADVNMVVNGTTALIVAVEKGHADIVRLLLHRGADVNMVVNDTTALIVAVKRGMHVELLLDRGADVNMVVNGTTALIAAIWAWGTDIVRLLLDRGADVNTVVNGTTALIAAVSRGMHVELLLDRGADVNMVDSNGTTALIVAVEKGHVDIVQLLLHRGADVDMVVNGTTALITAICAWVTDIVRLLLDRGADMNTVVNGTTALITAVERGMHVELLLDRGADVNMVGGNGTTALIVALEKGHADIVRLLLHRGADVSMVVNGTTALIVAVERGMHVELLLDRGADVNMVGSNGTTALTVALEKGHADIVRLLLHRGADVNMVVNGTTALITAIPKGDVQLLRLLVKWGADVNRIGGHYGTAIGAALAACAGWEPERLYDILQYLLGKGADVNTVSSQQFGSALGYAAYMGDTKLVSFLLEHGADPFHVGSTYNRAALAGAYPNALDAALSSGSRAGPGLIAVLSDAMKFNERGSLPLRCPPFPMPFTRPGLSPTAPPLTGFASCPKLEGIHNAHAASVLTAQQADIPCTELEEELLVQALVQLVIGTGTDTPEFALYEDWIRNDVWYFATQGYDFGEAYAAARVGWRHFNKPDFVHLVAQHRGHWLRIAQQIDEERVNSIYQDSTGQEMIKLPYEVMPRRLWDLKSNRVVEFRMLHSELLADKCITERQLGKERAKTSHQRDLPAYWAITHSWESSMDVVDTPINQHQWQVPLPCGLDLDKDVRQELLNFGISYVWLDVLCLRQHTSSNKNPSNAHMSEATLNEIKAEEWKLDVPTIGNIYRAAQGIVRYFNGLGRPFKTEGWDDCRHWLRRAWTLQEIKTENSTINGGIPRDSAGSTANIMNRCGTVAGAAITLRRAIRPVLKLAADVDSPSGCSLYGLAREMSQRVATQDTDKVSGLVYLLRLTQLPTYNEKVSDEDAWTKCLRMLPLSRRIELLFDFPYRSEKQKWFPTWRELLAWPEIDPDCDYSPAARAEGHIHLEKQDLVDLTESGEVTSATSSLFMSDIWALSGCHITHLSAEARGYEVKVKGKIYGFYGPYVAQKPIPITSPPGQLHEFTIAAAGLGHSNNWAVCEVVKTLETRCKSASYVLGLKKVMNNSGTPQGNSSEPEIEVHVLRKIGVLRTDFCGEILAGAGADGSDSALQRINALFV